MSKKRQKRAPECAEKAGGQKIACSEFWEPCLDGIVAGVAFGKEGLQMVQLWPDGEEPRLDVVTWTELDAGVQVVIGKFFTWLRDVWVDTSVAGLSGRNAKRATAIMEELSTVLPECGIRVVQVSSANHKAVPDAKARAVQVAVQAFQAKLRWLKRLNQHSCEKLLLGEIGTLI